jgi:hypothetical protein
MNREEKAKKMEERNKAFAQIFRILSVDHPPTQPEFSRVDAVGNSLTRSISRLKLQDLAISSFGTGSDSVQAGFAARPLVARTGSTCLYATAFPPTQPTLVICAHTGKGRHYLDHDRSFSVSTLDSSDCACDCSMFDDHLLLALLLYFGLVSSIFRSLSLTRESTSRTSISLALCFSSRLGS